jgi:formate-dependent nitrite reductase membrane component NrfD
MDTDLILVIGIVLCGLSIPSLLSAYVEGRPPRSGSLLVFIGGVLIVVALTQSARGYAFEEVPGVFFSVIGRYLN